MLNKRHTIEKGRFYFYRINEIIKRIVIEIELKMELPVSLPQGGTISLKPLSHSCPSHFALHFFISGVSIASAEFIIFSHKKSRQHPNYDYRDFSE